MGVVEELFIGRDGIVRAAKLRTPCNDTHLNPTAVEFRPRRDAAGAARQRIQYIVEQDT